MLILYRFVQVCTDLYRFVQVCTGLYKKFYFFIYDLYSIFEILEFSYSKCFIWPFLGKPCPKLQRAITSKPIVQKSCSSRTSEFLSPSFKRFDEIWFENSIWPWFDLENSIFCISVTRAVRELKLPPLDSSQLRGFLKWWDTFRNDISPNGHF